ncbi:hypothetical protein HGI47_20460 [Novosphingobium sp. ERN07]|uniref:imm11 family protein n=1 Tax=Novosphingobium sp. ERN07 TaxID=2726187 RepID=UPI0014578CDE|nr:DUF1629 domain-containing protein [Novosphingobium sp. ERN07]NLR73246.1 hypothetical protein [Novosphingobium sp. ERN07]
MAWILQHDGSQFSSVKFEMEPPCRDLTPSIEYYQENNCLKLYGKLWWSAVDIDDRFWPLQARMKTERKALPHWLGFCSFWGVSKSFRECVEHVEPGLHEFRKVEVLAKDGSPYSEAYYALNVRRKVFSAIDWGNTTAPFEQPRETRLLRSPQTLLDSQTVALKKSKMEGVHLSIMDETYPGTCMAVSNELYKLLSQRQLLRGTSSVFASEY